MADGATRARRTEAGADGAEDAGRLRLRGTASRRWRIRPEGRPMKTRGIGVNSVLRVEISELILVHTLTSYVD